jgi:hypothetical protein
VVGEADLAVLLRQLFEPAALSRSADLNRDGRMSVADVPAFVRIAASPSSR